MDSYLAIMLILAGCAGSKDGAAHQCMSEAALDEMLAIRAELNGWISKFEAVNDRKPQLEDALAVSPALHASFVRYHSLCADAQQMA